MNCIAYRRVCVLAAALLVLTGCASISTSPQQETQSGWRILQHEPGKDIRIRDGFAGPSRAQVRLGAVSLAPDSNGSAGNADSQALEDLRLALEEQLRLALGGQDEPAATLNVRLLEAQAVSPVVNVLTGVLLFVPLDTGAIVVEAELVAHGGERIAFWRERITGDYLDIGASFSRWGRISNALERWVQRCLDEPGWLGPGPSTAKVS